MVRGPWWSTVHRAAKSDTTEQLHFHFGPKEKGKKKVVCVVGLREEVRDRLIK